MRTSCDGAADNGRTAGYGDLVGADHLLFTYGTLQDPQVQLDVFGRRLTGTDDVLGGFTVDYVEIVDPRVGEATRRSVQPVLRETGQHLDNVTGTVLPVDDDELDACDEYQAPLYRRVAVVLRSGRRAWAYVSH